MMRGRRGKLFPLLFDRKKVESNVKMARKKCSLFLRGNFGPAIAGVALEPFAFVSREEKRARGKVSRYKL